MSSSWATKFEKKLKALTEGGASKESIQTLATWMVFNRKHVSAFSQVLLSLPDLTSAAVAVSVGVPNATATTSKQTLYWQLIHQVLLSNKEDQDKWERALDMRITMGESVILVALPNLCSNNNNNDDDDETSTTATIMDLVEGMIKEWDQYNVFGGPTLTGQIKRILLTAKSTMSTPALTTSTTTTTTDVSPKVAESAAASASAVVKAEQVETIVPPTAKLSPVEIETSSPPQPLSASSSPQQPQQPPPPSPGGKQLSQNHQRRESMSSVHSEQPTAPFEYNFDNSVRGGWQKTHFLCCSFVVCLVLFLCSDMCCVHSLTCSLSHTRRSPWVLWNPKNFSILARPWRPCKLREIFDTKHRYCCTDFYRIYPRIFKTMFRHCFNNKISSNKIPTPTNPLYQ